MSQGFAIAVVGARSAGKAELVQGLAAALRAQGLSVAMVDAHDAEEQGRRVREQSLLHEVVVVDATGPLAGGVALGLTLLAASAEPPTPGRSEHAEAWLRASLRRAGVAYSVVSGDAAARLASALLAVRHAMRAVSPEDEARSNPRWQWVCERCGDVDCERHLLPRIAPQ